MNMYSDIEKIIKVINSCVTVRQFDVAGRLISNFVRTWKLKPSADGKHNAVVVGLWDEVDKRLEQLIYDGTEPNSQST